MTPISSDVMRVSVSPTSSPSPRTSRTMVKKNLAVLREGHDKEKCELVVGRGGIRRPGGRAP